MAIHLQMARRTKLDDEPNSYMGKWLFNQTSHLKKSVAWSSRFAIVSMERNPLASKKKVSGLQFPIPKFSPDPRWEIFSGTSMRPSLSWPLGPPKAQWSQNVSEHPCLASNARAAYKPRWLHPGRLTWNIQITHLERKMIFQTPMIMFHVNLPGCNNCFHQQL